MKIKYKQTYLKLEDLEKEKVIISIKIIMTQENHNL